MTTSTEQEIQKIMALRNSLQRMMASLLASIGDVQIGTHGQFPYGWRKAAKGRTVWRLLEELISQNIEARHRELGMQTFTPADSEVGVYDFMFTLPDDVAVYVNVKSAVRGGRTNKDDISKARSLEQFFSADPARILLVATVEIEFLTPMAIRLLGCSVVPVMWLPDIYVNPSNNGNLQSSQYKNLAAAQHRTGAQFLTLLREAIATADEKRRSR